MSILPLLLIPRHRSGPGIVWTALHQADDTCVPPFTLCQAWHEIHRHDPAHRWLREQVVRADRRGVGDKREQVRTCCAPGQGTCRPLDGPPCSAS